MAWIFIQKKKKLVIGHVLTRAQGSKYGTIIYIYIYIYIYDVAEATRKQTCCFLNGKRN